MVQTLQAKNVTLRDLIDQFKLWFSQDDRFFFEWQEGLLNLAEEMQFLAQITRLFKSSLDEIDLRCNISVMIFNQFGTP